MAGPGPLGTEKDVEDLARRARKTGWVVAIDGANHICWRAPEGRGFRSALTGSRGTRLRVERNLARLDPAHFDPHYDPRLPTPPERVDIAAEAATAREELLACAELLEGLAANGDAEEAADLLRLTRGILREGEERLRSARRKARCA